jgi:hypothetical protein
MSVKTHDEHMKALKFKKYDMSDKTEYTFRIIFKATKDDMEEIVQYIDSYGTCLYEEIEDKN